MSVADTGLADDTSPCVFLVILKQKLITDTKYCSSQAYFDRLGGRNGASSGKVLEIFINFFILSVILISTMIHLYTNYQKLTFNISNSYPKTEVEI